MENRGLNTRRFDRTDVLVDELRMRGFMVEIEDDGEIGMSGPITYTLIVAGKQYSSLEGPFSLDDANTISCRKWLDRGKVCTVMIDVENNRLMVL